MNGWKDGRTKVIMAGRLGAGCLLCVNIYLAVGGIGRSTAGVSGGSEDISEGPQAWQGYL